MTPQWRHNIWNNGLLYCFSNNFFRLASKKASKLNTTKLCETNPMITVWFPYTKAVIKCTHTLTTLLMIPMQKTSIGVRRGHECERMFTSLRSLALLSCLRHTIDLEPVVPREHLRNHFGNVIMGAIPSQITSLNIFYSTVCSDTNQRKYQSSASLAFVWGIHWGPVNSPHKWPVTPKMFPFDDVIMTSISIKENGNM